MKAFHSRMLKDFWREKLVKMLISDENKSKINFENEKICICPQRF
jgi:hypothetical protein